jgi:sulfur carrier protein
MSPTTDAQISVTVNGDERTVPDGYPLTEVLHDLEIDPEEGSGVAVAINESVIRRQDWGDVTLSEEDTVEVIQAQQGG